MERGARALHCTTRCIDGVERHGTHGSVGYLSLSFFLLQNVIISIESDISVLRYLFTWESSVTMTPKVIN